MCPLFIRMLTVILIMLICSSFIRVNMLRAHLKMNFVFGTNTDEYKESLSCVLRLESQKAASPRCSE